MMRIYCDACDRDISDEPHVRLIVEVPFGPWPPQHKYKVKPKLWDWCQTCAKSHGIEFEEVDESAE
jgi:hypothetical protein